MKGQIVMSSRELDKVKLISQVAEKKMSMEECSELLGITKRQGYRLLHRYRMEGEVGLIHKSRGRKSNHSCSLEHRREIIAIYRSRYSDYGPTLFSEKLYENHGIKHSRETLRLWMRLAGIMNSQRKKRPHRKRRERMSGLGEMVQFDGSIHDWFEGRGEVCCLLVVIDDATSRVMLRFAASENSRDAMHLMRAYVEKNGCPRSIYTDRGSVYYAEQTVTDFTRSLEELGCKAIYANSAQAKGRVERANKTLQDRLVKALRDGGISTIGAANKYLTEEFTEAYNEQFAVVGEYPDVHYSAEGRDLNQVFCYKTFRQVRNDYTVTLDGVYLQLERGSGSLPLPGRDVVIRHWLNGELHIYYEQSEVKYRILPGKPKAKRRGFMKPKEEHPWRIKNQLMNRAKGGRNGENFARP